VAARGICHDPFHRNTAARSSRIPKTAFHILDSAGGLLIGARRDAIRALYWRITQ